MKHMSLSELLAHFNKFAHESDVSVALQYHIGRITDNEKMQFPYFVYNGSSTKDEDLLIAARDAAIRAFMKSVESVSSPDTPPRNWTPEQIAQIIQSTIDGALKYYKEFVPF